jgi:hypothetical protein
MPSDLWNAMKKDIEDHYPNRRQWQSKQSVFVLDKISLGSYAGTSYSYSCNTITPLRLTAMLYDVLMIIGWRHHRALPVRGQRTSGNASTAKKMGKHFAFIFFMSSSLCSWV